MHPAYFEIFVEEPSMERFLHALLDSRKHLRGYDYEIHAFQGKDDLLKNLTSRLKGHANWLPPGFRIVLLVDRDNEDCVGLKDRLENICAEVGLTSRRVSRPPNWQVVTRIVIEELEAWYFGDWSAVKAAYPRVSANIPQQAPYRNPDAIKGGTWEAFERVMKDSGYRKNTPTKVEAARCIGSQIDPGRNRSPSFQVFWEALQETFP